MTVLYPSYKTSKMRPVMWWYLWTLLLLRYDSCLHFNNFDLREFLWKAFSRLALKGTWLDRCCHKTHQLHDCSFHYLRGLGSKDFNVTLVDGSRLLFIHHKNCLKPCQETADRFSHATQDGLQSLCWSPEVLLSNTLKKNDVSAMGLFLCFVIIKPC